MGVKEFQAVVMAGGKGSRMTDLTARKPKCLLPIGNLPMVWYPIRFLEKSGFQDVVVAVGDGARAEVQQSLERTGIVGTIRCDIVGIPSSAEDWGTADTLRYLVETSKIKCDADVVVVPCDLVTDVDMLPPLLNTFRRHNAAVAALFFRPDPSRATGPPPPGPKSKEKPERDLVMLDPRTSRLALLASASDFEESVSIARGLLRRHGGRLRAHSRLLDAHVYVVRRWLCRYLMRNKNISTLKGELVPHTVKHQFSGSDRRNADLLELAKEDSPPAAVAEMSSAPKGEGEGADPVRCYALLAPDGARATRANTLADYCRANRMVLSGGAWPEGVSRAPPTSISAVQGSLSADSAAAAGAAVAEKASVRASALGQDSTVGQRSRLTDTVVMAGARIGQNCTLSNCVVGEGAIVGDGCQLTDCLIGDRHSVPAGEKHANQVLTDDDHLIEIV